MALKKDHSALPTGDTVIEEPPHFPTYGPVLAKAWFEEVDQTVRAKAADTRLRNSQAGFCTRAVQYEVMGVEKSNPTTPADYWRFGLGTMIHDLWQARMELAFPGARSEVKVTYDDFESSGHIDLVIEDPHLIALELKTINGFGFKRAIGARGAAEGPKNSHKLQAALNGYGIGADEIVIVYLSLENLSPREIKQLLGHDPQEEHEFFQQFTAEWRYDRDTFVPWAEAEMRRLTRVLDYVDSDQLVPRFTPEMPKAARIVDPATGRWEIWDDSQTLVGAGSAWNCAYCDHRDRCIADG